MWDHPTLFPNGHILTIYLEFVPIHGDGLGWFTKCECKDENIHFFHGHGFLTVATIVG
jgi:hypothetical protein